MYEIEDLDAVRNWLSFMHEVAYRPTNIDSWETDTLSEVTKRLDQYKDSVHNLTWSEETKSVYDEALRTYEFETFVHEVESPGYVREAYLRKLQDYVGRERTLELMQQYCDKLDTKELKEFISDETRRADEYLGKTPGITGAVPSGRARMNKDIAQKNLHVTSDFLATATHTYLIRKGYQKEPVENEYEALAIFIA